MSLAADRALYHLLWVADQLSMKNKEELWFAGARASLSTRLTPRSAEQNVFQPMEERHDQFLSARMMDQLPLDRPLVFRGLMNGTRARNKWTFDFLAETCKDLPQPFFRASQGTLAMEVLPFRKGVEGILRGTPPYSYIGGTFDVLKHYPALGRDLDLDRVIDPAFFRKKFNVHHKLFLSADKSWSPIHAEFGVAFNLLIKGKKRWLILRPEDSCLLHPAITRNLWIFSERYSRASDLENARMGLRGWEVVVDEGDVLYFPPYFWHYVENLANSISIESKWADIPMFLRHPFLLSVILSARNPSLLRHFKGVRDPSMMPPANMLSS